MQYIWGNVIYKFRSLVGLMGMIQVQNLCKRYGDFTAVQDMSFCVNKGEIFGIVGPNGAGKTTILKMCCGLIKPTEGNISIAGYNFEKNEIKIKSIIGFIPEDSPLYESMYINDYLQFFAEIFGVDKKTADRRIEKLLTSLNLSVGQKKTGDCSKGMKRKVVIARALINDPEVLICDEPTSGLDPMTSTYVIDFIKVLKSQGKTILFSAHNLYQVESVCDRVMILNGGKKIACGSVDEIKKDFGRVEYSIEFSINGTSDRLFRQKGFYLDRKDGHYLTKTNSIEELNQITELVSKVGGKIVDIRTEESSLEEIFVDMIDAR